MIEKNIFQDFIEDSVHAEMLHIKSYLASLVVEVIAQQKWTQSKAAEELSIAQPRISEIKQAKLEKFSVDFLLTILAKLGYRFEIGFTPKNLKKPIQVTLKQAK